MTGSYAKPINLSVFCLLNNYTILKYLTFIKYFCFIAMASPLDSLDVCSIIIFSFNVYCGTL